MARELGGSDVLVTLKRPAPLGVDLSIDTDTDTGSAVLRHGGDVLATAERADLDIAVPGPPSMAEARAAELRFDQAAHIYPGCFVCGPAREPGDGWRIFAGPIRQGRVAASWTAGSEFVDGDGIVKPEFVWAALDCPGYFAVQEAAGLALLGRMGVVAHHPIPCDVPLIIHGWDMGSDGRKHSAGTAIHSADGELLAAARQTWVTLR